MSNNNALNFKRLASLSKSSNAAGPATNFIRSGRAQRVASDVGKKSSQPQSQPRKATLKTGNTTMRRFETAKLEAEEDPDSDSDSYYYESEESEEEIDSFEEMEYDEDEAWEDMIQEEKRKKKKLIELGDIADVSNLFSSENLQTSGGSEK